MGAREQIFSRRSFLAALAGIPHAAAAPWDERAFPDWSEVEVERLLTNSPWAKPLALAFELRPPPAREIDEAGRGTGFASMQWPGGGRPPGGVRLPSRGQGSQGHGSGSSVRAEAYLTVRWSSALPIRQALLIEEYGAGRRIPEEALASLDREETDYVVEVFGLPAQVVHDPDEKLEAELVSTSRLSVRGRRPIRAGTVRVPPQGAYRSFTLRFPKSEPLGIADNEVEVFAAAGPFEFRKVFKLKPMVYRGKLEL